MQHLLNKQTFSMFLVSFVQILILLRYRSGHEFPFAIKMNHMREAATQDEDGFANDFNQLPCMDPLSPESQCQFILKKTKKSTNRVTLGKCVVGAATASGFGAETVPLSECGVGVVTIGEFRAGTVTVGECRGGGGSSDTRRVWSGGSHDR